MITKNRRNSKVKNALPGVSQLTESEHAKRHQQMEEVRQRINDKLRMVNWRLRLSA